MDAGFTGSVTANLYNQAHVLVGTKTVTAASGVATFAGLTLDAAASGYTITLSSTATGAPPSITTNALDVFPRLPRRSS